MSLISKIVYYPAFAIDCIAVLIALYFIYEDMTRFSGHPKNGGSGLILVTLILCAWVAASYFMFQNGPKGLAIVLAWIPATPVLLYGLFILMFIVLKPDMK
jgi:hypothetical protein